MSLPTLPVLYLIEDDPDDQRLLQWTIRKSGLPIAVRHAGDGEEAIEYLARRILPECPAPDRLFLVLSDINLPRRSGWDVLRWIRNNPSYAHLPVLMWTSLPNPDGERKAQQLGATSYFSKPLDNAGYRKLLAVIGDHLRD